MKNYHALGILIAATVVFVSACSMAHAAAGMNGAIASTIMGASQPVQSPDDKRPAICPTATEENSGYIVTDEDNDGKPDTVWHVYMSGTCAGWTVGVNDRGTPL
jgi:hypothetical protein